MYAAFYSLQKKPFGMTPDPSFLYMTSQHREALAGLTYAILDRKGFLVLSGMAGAGKTTLLAWVLQKLPCDKVRSSVILNPTLTRDEFLELAMLDFGIDQIPASKAQRLWALQNHLLESSKQGMVNVLIVDEAHKLSYELLEEIRLLGNMEYGDEKLIQILLLGQSELDDVLSRQDLWQLKQRISVRLTIGALSTEDVEHYVQHRWTVAGGQIHPFAPEAIARLRTWSQGIPRLINSICDNALTLAFAESSLKVQAAHVDAAAGDLRLIPKAQAPAVVAAPAAAHAPVQAAATAHSAAPAAAPVPVAAAPVNGTSSPRPDKVQTQTQAAVPVTSGIGKPAPVRLLGQYADKPRKRSAWLRFTDRLGWSSNGNGNE
jgi:general secretion pathway protein A